MFIKDPIKFGPPAANKAFKTELNPEMVYVPGASTCTVIFTTTLLAFLRLTSMSTLLNLSFETKPA